MPFRALSLAKGNTPSRHWKWGCVTATNLDELFAPEVVADPYTYFARLREIDPVYWNERFQLWVITG
ncbi:MAG: hypothetical protein KAJ43_10930, partial [Gemmatimonadetes bacterium]|nr:hypothetical protein [Gemmatimonadota bacterium]